MSGHEKRGGGGRASTIPLHHRLDRYVLCYYVERPGELHVFFFSVCFVLVWFSRRNGVSAPGRGRRGSLYLFSSRHFSCPRSGLSFYLFLQAFFFFFHHTCEWMDGVGNGTRAWMDGRRPDDLLLFSRLLFLPPPPFFKF